MWLCVSNCFLKFVHSKASLSLQVLSSLFMSGVSTLEVEPTGMLVVAIGMLSPAEGNLLGVNRDVTALNADCIIPSCIWGSSSKSLTVAMLEPSGWLTSTLCSMMGLVGVIKMGVLALIVVLFMGHYQGLLNSACGLYSMFGWSSTTQHAQKGNGISLTVHPD